MHKRNWKQYNRSLVQRGSITFWIDKKFLQEAKFQESTKGRPKFASSIIHMGWILKTVYKLTFRSLEGYFQSLLALLGIEQTVPHYSLFCKRGKEVAKLLPKLSSKRPMELVIDASGLKIYGEGEWKIHQHGREHVRKWIKVHVAVDPRSGECIAVEITDEKRGDPSQFPSLIHKSPKSVKIVYADGAYDTIRCRKTLSRKSIEGIIPPRKTGVLRNEKELSGRNNNLKEIRGLGGDIDLWKKLSRYGTRSLAETFFSRLKMLFGERLLCKKFENQKLETLLRIHSLNAIS